MITLLPYQASYSELFVTDLGRQTLAEVARLAAAQTSEFTASDMISLACKSLGCVDGWDVLNALDHLVTAAILRELTDRDNVCGQDRRYVVL